MNFILRNLAERHTQVSLASTWTLGVRWVCVILEFLIEIFVKIWKRKHHLRDYLKSSPGRHRSNTKDNTPCKQGNVILFKNRKHVDNSDDLSMIFFS